jgi:hypothetical protein
MKILIVGSDNVYSIENFYLQHIGEAGLQTDLFPAQRYFYGYYQKNILNKLLYRAGLSRILQGINRSLLESVELLQPSVVWVFKGMEIFPATLKKIKERGIKLVNYNPDNPFIFTGTGSGNKNITDSIGLYDLHFTYNLAIKRQLESTYGVATSFLPFGYELGEETYYSLTMEPEILRVCFAGNPDVQRATFIKALLAEGVPIDLYGHGWDKFVRHSQARTFSAVYKNEFWKVLRKYRVQLNLMRMHNEDSHNMRSFEAPAAGGIMLAPRTTEHALFFKEGEEAFFFSDIRECVQKVGSLMALSEKTAHSIRLNARNKSVTAGYSYKARAVFAVAEMKHLI